MVAGGAACACVAVAVADPEQRQLTPSCPFQAATGWWCPFCGATRSVARLVRGDVAVAARYNLVLVLGVALAGIVLVLRRTPVIDRVRSFVGPRATGLVVAAAVLLMGFTVFRNVPGFDAHLRYPGA